MIRLWVSRLGGDLALVGSAELDLYLPWPHRLADGDLDIQQPVMEVSAELLYSKPFGRSTTRSNLPYATCQKALPFLAKFSGAFRSPCTIS